MPGEPNAVLNSKNKKKKKKKKVWETVKPDLRVDASNVATYKDSFRKLRIDYSSSFVVAAAAADAVIMAASIADAQIALLEILLEQLH